MKVKINEEYNYLVELDASFKEGKINEKPFEWDMIQLKENSFHIIKENVSYNVEVITVDYHKKRVELKINGNIYQAKLTNKIDELLKQLGMDDIICSNIKELKAPMPGLVLDIMIESGNKVEKGEPLFILEAMKMENILKSPTDGVIRKVYVDKKDTIEKNQVLVDFE